MRTRMFASLGLLVLALGLGACASPRIAKTPGWKPEDKAWAQEARAGRFRAKLSRAMDVAQYLFETEGFLFTRRDDDKRSFRTEPLRFKEGADPEVVELKLTEDKGVVQTAWTHWRVTDLKEVDACAGDEACQKAFNDDWNWRLYRVP